MQCLKKIALAAVLAAAMVCSAKELKVLTIGNSFADSAFHYLPSVVKSVHVVPSYEYAYLPFSTVFPAASMQSVSKRMAYVSSASSSAGDCHVSVTFSAVRMRIDTAAPLP